MPPYGTKAWAAGEVATASNMNLYTGPIQPAVNIDVLTGAYADTNWTTRAQSGTYYYSGSIASSGAQNDSVSFLVALAAGTYSLIVAYVTGTSQGIHQFSLSTDNSTFTALNASPYNASASTIDAYVNPGAANNFTTITGITIATNGVYVLRDRMETKNASAASYIGTLQHLQLNRTA